MNATFPESILPKLIEDHGADAAGDVVVGQGVADAEGDLANEDPHDLRRRLRELVLELSRKYRNTPCDDYFDEGFFWRIRIPLSDLNGEGHHAETVKGAAA